MPEPSPSDLRDLDQWKHWKPEYQQRALELLKQRENTPWRPFYCLDPRCTGHAHVTPAADRSCEAVNGHEWIDMAGTWLCAVCEVTGTPRDDWLFEHARKDQRPPRWRDDWLTWALSSGRGSGKTKTGSEVTHRATDIYPRIILIAPTGPDLRDTMVEGISGLLATAHPDKRPTWEPSKKRLTWPNGCIGQGFSAEEPDRLRGPQAGFVWGDEPAHWNLVEACWENMLYGLRIPGKRGLGAKIVATSTPKATKWMRATLDDPLTVVHRVSSYFNVRNLDAQYRKNVLDPRKGTRLGQQELYGELLEDVEGALWNWDMIHYIEQAPADLVKVVVGVDPAGSTNKRSDETGIIVVGIDSNGVCYVLADLTGKYSPAQWADKAVQAYEDFSCDEIVAEKNYGGDMVKNTLENSRLAGALKPKIELVESRRGKELRATPVVAYYERTKVLHVGKRGDLDKLEDEQTTWVPGESDSPNRVDALVHSVTRLARAHEPVAFADPRQVLGDRVRSIGSAPSRRPGWGFGQRGRPPWSA
jgi:phage terminase large subunit-like protein